MVRGQKILITCGPTWVPIDSVRVISNTSTGELGHLLAQKLHTMGARVTLLEGQVTHQLNDPAVKRIGFTYFDEFKTRLTVELKKNYDCVIHAAAVSDYRLKKAGHQKISSHKRSLTLTLVPTPKLIEKFKKIAPKTFLVGFKLEPNLTRSNLAAKTRDLFKKSGCDLVVANSINKGQYKAFVVNPDGKILFTTNSKNHLSDYLIKFVIPA